MKREPRLKFTQEEMDTPELEKPIRKVKKAAAKADKAQAKIPKKTVKTRTVDPATGKVTTKLSFEDKKPPSKLSHAAKAAPVNTASIAAHREIRQYEDENVGLEAAHFVEGNAESGARLTTSAVRSQRLRPYRKAAAAESKLEKANLNALYKKAELEQPTSNPVSKWQQRRAIRKQYAAAKAGRSAETTKQAAEATGKAAEAVRETAKKTADFVRQHKKGFLIVGAVGLALAFMDRRIDLTALAVWKRLFPRTYNQMQIPMKQLSNLPHRHAGYDSKTFAVQVEGKWFGITYAFISHSNYEKRPFDQKMTPYTADGRKRYQAYRKRHTPLPLDRPSVNTPEDIRLALAGKGKHRKYNFEYFMNREYAYNRDRGKCKCCGISLAESTSRHCHHIRNTLHIEDINKVRNLAWLCESCHRMVHNGMIPPGLESKVVNKIESYRKKLNP